MTKKLTILLLLTILLRLQGWSQTVVWDEPFTRVPDGWEFSGNWDVTDGALSMFYYPIVTNYDFEALSPEIEIPVNGADLTLMVFVDTYNTYVTNEVCEISVVGDGFDDVLWSHQLSNGLFGSYLGAPVTLILDSYSNETVRLKLHSYGATTQAIWGWYIYSINMTSLFDHDLRVVEIAGPGHLDPNQTGTWTVEIENLGAQPESGFELKLFSTKAMDELATAYYNQTLLPGQTGSVQLQWFTSEVHNTTIDARIISNSDQWAQNNRSKPAFLRIEPEVNYAVLLWDNDNGIPNIQNPETGQEEDASTGIQSALNLAGIDYTLVNDLPADLSFWDIVIVTMGCYCLD
mgnify:CR=1 FL=1